MATTEEIEWTQSQKRARKEILDWYHDSPKQYFVLAGYAGTGKTTLISRIVNVDLKLEPDVSAMFVTPTGKAATVIIRKGTKAGTVHRLIYQTIEEEYVEIVQGKEVRRRRIVFRKKPDIDSAIKLIIVDEVSMVSDNMLQDLFSFGVKCLLCGDTAQLPPVGGTNTLLSSPDFTLTDIVRQAWDNPIIQIATKARNGERLPYCNLGDPKTGDVHILPASRVDNWHYAEDRKKMLLHADQIIVGRNATRHKINREIRSLLGYDVRNPLPQENEKIICTLNNWETFVDYEERYNLVNGIIGYAHDVRTYEQDIGQLNFRAEFLQDVIADLVFDTGIFLQGEYAYDFGQTVLALSDGSFVPKGDKRGDKDDEALELRLNRFELAHAITCHKAQGSEFDYVAVFDESYAFADKARWLYTAVTRAKKRLFILRGE